MRTMVVFEITYRNKTFGVPFSTFTDDSFSWAGRERDLETALVYQDLKNERCHLMEVCSS